MSPLILSLIICTTLSIAVDPPPPTPDAVTRRLQHLASKQLELLLHAIEAIPDFNEMRGFAQSYNKNLKPFLGDAVTRVVEKQIGNKANQIAATVAAPSGR